MRTIFAALLAFFCGLAFGQAASQQQIRDELLKLQWQKTGMGHIADKAEIAIADKHLFLDSKNTRRFLELMGNPPGDGHFTYAPASMNWFAIFSFADSGYVKDDEKIDADELLRTLKESDGPSNEERKRLGMNPIYTDGWQVPPHYNAETKRLEWGVRLKTASGEPVVNYTARLLGRSGVMSATLVSDPEHLPQDMAEFKTSLEKFSYVLGEKYTEFKQGDRVAEFGLAALILGGAAAVATKKGFWGAVVAFFAAFWKVILGAGIGVLAGLGSLFKRKK